MKKPKAIDPRVGMIIRVARTRLKLTLREVAEALQVSTGYVSDMERGQRDVTQDRAAQLAKTLRLSKVERGRLYQYAAILPDGTLDQLLKAPDLWRANFRALSPLIDNAISTLRAQNRTLAEALTRAKYGTTTVHAVKE